MKPITAYNSHNSVREEYVTPIAFKFKALSRTSQLHTSKSFDVGTARPVIGQHLRLCRDPWRDCRDAKTRGRGNANGGRWCFRAETIEGEIHEQNLNRKLVNLYIPLYRNSYFRYTYNCVGWAREAVLVSIWCLFIVLVELRGPDSLSSLTRRVFYLLWSCCGFSSSVD